MSEWCLKSKKEVQHTNGYTLTLNEGSWAEPKDLRPCVPKSLNLNPLETVRQMREGLEFARVNSEVKI